MNSSEPMVTLEIKMTPEEYVTLKNNCLWQSTHGDVGRYLVEYALGKTRKGC